MSRPHALNVSRYTKEGKIKMLLFGSFPPKKMPPHSFNKERFGKPQQQSKELAKS
ncbi:hypothetical protein [Acetobacter persici]|uniref:hypothetical protein n=1 Tax=Acetobacter persici TaxID=1076596 RepID=UPI001BA98D27|nr:hypothetical protein [Acetobacter persici]MBS1017311.1 hypothetical protein [Acetobacter persici]